MAQIRPGDKSPNLSFKVTMGVFWRGYGEGKWINDGSQQSDRFQRLWPGRNLFRLQLLQTFQQITNDIRGRNNADHPDSLQNRNRMKIILHK